MKSNLIKAKGNGSAGSGSDHWLLQRITGIGLTLLTTWLVFFCHDIARHSELTEIIIILQKPHNILPLGIFVVVSFYHAFLGMQVVIEDYINSRFVRLSSILFLQFFSIVTVCAFIIAVIYVMTL